MSYADYETSTAAGAPLELYEFTYGALGYRYTGADADVNLGESLYTATVIAASGIDKTQALGKQDVKLSVPRDFPVAALFRIAPPALPIKLTIKRLHRSDPDAQAIVVWIGRVMSAEWRGASATLACQSLVTALKRAGLRRHYQLNCPHVLYSAPCGASRAAVRTTARLTTVAGATLSADAFAVHAEGWWVGGWVESLGTNGVNRRRGVTGHSTNTVTLAQPMPGLAAGATVTIYPGCDHTRATCQSKFANILNYGGFPWIPHNNPFRDQIY